MYMVLVYGNCPRLGTCILWGTSTPSKLVKIAGNLVNIYCWVDLVKIGLHFQHLHNFYRVVKLLAGEQKTHNTRGFFTIVKLNFTLLFTTLIRPVISFDTRSCETKHALPSKGMTGLMGVVNLWVKSVSPWCKTRVLWIFCSTTENLMTS